MRKFGYILDWGHPEGWYRKEPNDMTVGVQIIPHYSTTLLEMSTCLLYNLSPTQYLVLSSRRHDRLSVHLVLGASLLRH